MRTVRLHGHLATFTPSIELDVTTAAEAIRALCVNFPGFAQALQTGYFEVVRGKTVEGGRALDIDEVKDFRLGRADLHIVPVAEGAKRGGALKVILGVALLGASAFLAAGSLASAVVAPKTLFGLTAGNAAFLGLGLTVAGASQLLTAQDKKNAKDEKSESYSLSGALNSYGQGSPVPLVYGEIITGGHVISAGIDIEQMKKNV